MVVRPAAAARATSAAGSSRPSEAVVCRCRSITRAIGRLERSSGACLGTARFALGGGGLALPFEEGAIFANQQLEMLALLGGELQEDLLAFGVLEAIAVALEETMRGALA